MLALAKFNGDFEKFIPVTFETQVIFPNKRRPSNGYNTSFTKSVIAKRPADASDGTDYTILVGDKINIQLYSERTRRNQKSTPSFSCLGAPKLFVV